MPTELPIRERIERAVATRLETITAGVTYHTSPSQVTRTLMPIDQYADELRARGPVVGVMRANGSMLVRGAIHPRSTADHQHVFAIYGYVIGEEQGNVAGDLLNRVWADTVTCLLADETLGGLTKKLFPTGPMETDEGVKEPMAFFRQLWLAVA